MFQKISHKFQLCLTMFVAILLLLAAGVRWAPGASAQGLVEYAIILAFVPEADCSVSGYEVKATDSLRIESLRVRGMRARETGNCEFTVHGRLSQVGPAHNIIGMSVHNGMHQIRKAEFENNSPATIDFVFWSKSTVEASDSTQIIFYPGAEIR